MRSRALHTIVIVLGLDACWHAFHVGEILLAWLGGEQR